jgi:hypothetical protein
MSNDLLFSVLPRRGTVPVKSERGEVKKIDKKTPVDSSREDENWPVIKQREQESPDQDQNSEQQSKDYSDEHIGLIVDTTDEVELGPDTSVQASSGLVEEYSPDGKDDEDDDHIGNNLDITV